MLLEKKIATTQSTTKTTVSSDTKPDGLKVKKRLAGDFGRPKLLKPAKLVKPTKLVKPAKLVKRANFFLVLIRNISASISKLESRKRLAVIALSVTTLPVLFIGVALAQTQVQTVDALEPQSAEESKEPLTSISDQSTEPSDEAPVPSPTPIRKNLLSQPSAPAAAPVGPRTSFVMPDFSGGNLEATLKSLRDLGMNHVTYTARASRLPKDVVASTFPAAGTLVNIEEWNNSKKMYVYTSSGSPQPIGETATMFPINPQLTWLNNGNPDYAVWSFQNRIQIDDGVLWVHVEATFPRSSTVLLGPSCSYLIEGTHRLGCHTAVPASIEAPAGQIVYLGRFGMNIFAVDVKAPTSFQMNLQVRDDRGVYSESLMFTVTGWEEYKYTGPNISTPDISTP